ncbi:hypothetical protein LF599_07585 [Pseudodesulfovibrio thermohalotolerans]|uniref:hypothetical protein n=1 Tax=Pseudodesulfovibrio thermohalotolerans TaxID=2880651 RepID=UPI0022B9E12E|nr:hypothetical protein [Pseudodesulfovibrio thermohalotolerans]WFS64016.1 hypothetical protein LF599_07585 [Pseudodesulfovibrio thermohalotolerans]
MADFTKPDLSSLYTYTFDEQKDKETSLALLFDGTSDTGLPVGTIRWTSTNNRFERWDGASWAELTGQYAINVETLGGETLDEIKAELAAQGHVHDGMITIDDLATYYTAAQVDVLIAAIPLGSDGTDHTHDDMVTTGTLTSYATIVYVDGHVEALDTRVTALEAKNFDDRYYTKTEADGKFQPLGDYLTTDDAVTQDQVYLKGEIDTKFLDKEETMTTAMADKMDADAGLADLSDVTGTANTVLGFDGDGAAIERPVADVSGAKTLTELTDAPDTYTDNAGKIVVVNDAEDGIEFASIEADWTEITDEQQFYSTSWNLNGGTWGWRLQDGQYQFRGAVSRPNTTSGWWQLTTTGNVSIPEATGQVVPIVAYKVDGIPVASAAKFVSATRIDLYIPDDSAAEWWFDFTGAVLNA